MRILALETSTELGSCALWCDGNLTEAVCPGGQTHAETLLPLAKNLLVEANLGFADLDVVAFGQGPGAFTGLRVACAASQGIAAALDIPVCPVVTLETMAESCRIQYKEQNFSEILCLLDARMNEVYAAHYRREGTSWRMVGEIGLYSPSTVPLPTQANLVLCGNALKVYPELKQRAEESGFPLYPEVMPMAVAVAMLASQKTEEWIDPELAAPVYVRDKVAKTIVERLAEGGKA